MTTVPGPADLLRLLAVLALVLPCPLALAAGQEEAEPEETEEVVAEALFLADTLPAGTRDFSLVLDLGRDEADGLGAASALQWAAPLGDRMGFTVDLGIARDGGALESPAGSLKLLVRDAGAARTGLSASVDFQGSLDRDVDHAVAVGLGALRPLGPVALRVTALAATGVSGWTPRLHAGLSGAVALSHRWRALVEAIAEVGGGETVVSAGPTLKAALSEHFAVMGGALFEVGRAAAPAFTLQLTSTL